MSKLIGSASSLEQLKEYIETKYLYNKIELVKLDNKTFLIKGSKGILEGFRIVLKGKRARLEMVG